MKSKIYIVMLIVAFVVGVFLKIKSCNSDNLAANWKARYDTLSAEFVTLKNKEGKQVVEQAPTVFSSDKILKQASAAAFNLSKKEERKVKEVNAFVEVEQAAIIKNDSAALQAITDTTQLRHFNINRPEYTLAGRVNNKFVYVDSLAIYNTISIRLAQKRKGLFKRELVVQATNSNRFITTPAIRSMVVEQRPTAWNKWIKPVLFAAAGLAVGRAVK